MKYKVQYVNGKMAEFEAESARIRNIGAESWLMLLNNDGFLNFILLKEEVLIAAIKTSSLWKVTTEEANETLVEEPNDQWKASHGAIRPQD